MANPPYAPIRHDVACGSLLGTGWTARGTGIAKVYERANRTAPSSPSAIEGVYRALISAQPPAWRRAIVAAAIREVEDLLVSSGPATRDAALDALEVLYQELFRLDARSATEALPVQPSVGNRPRPVP